MGFRALGRKLAKQEQAPSVMEGALPFGLGYSSIDIRDSGRVPGHEVKIDLGAFAKKTTAERLLKSNCRSFDSPPPG
jgi:hypothetical protein